MRLSFELTRACLNYKVSKTVDTICQQLQMKHELVPWNWLHRTFTAQFYLDWPFVILQAVDVRPKLMICDRNRFLICQLNVLNDTFGVEVSYFCIAFVATSNMIKIVLFSVVIMTLIANAMQQSRWDILHILMYSETKL